MFGLGKRPDTAKLEQELRAAHEQLKHAKAQEPHEVLESIGRCGVHPQNGFHPDHDHGKLLVAEAQLRVAEARHAYSAADPEITQLCRALDAALANTRDQLAAIVDEPEPTLASTPEAKAEHDEACARHAEALKVARAERLSILGHGAKRIAKACIVAPRMLDEISSAVEDTRAQLEAVLDPEAPELGAPTPVTVAALSRALAAHRVATEANAKRRDDTREDLVPVLAAIQSGLTALGAKRRKAGLPMPREGLFNCREVSGQFISVGAIAQSVHNLTPERIDVLRAAIGCAPANRESPKRVIADIARRRREFEIRQAEKAANVERHGKVFLG